LKFDQRESRRREVALSVGTSTSSTTSTSSSTSASSSTPQVSQTTKNLQNLLVEYGASESKDVQDMLERVASQLGVNINDIRAAVAADAKTKSQADAAAKVVSDAAAKKAAAEAAAIRKRQEGEQAQRAAEASRRHRLNDWQATYSARVANSGH
jgi:DNA-binding transcriptional MerR regulator